MCRFGRGRILCGQDCSRMIRVLEILQSREEKKKRPGKIPPRREMTKEQQSSRYNSTSAVSYDQPGKHSTETFESYSTETFGSYSSEDTPSPEDVSNEGPVKGEKGVKLEKEKGEKLSYKQLKVLVEAAVEEQEDSPNPLCKEEPAPMFRSNLSDIAQFE